MMSYQDRTFCPFYEDCRDQKECSRPLTSEVRDRAAKWWGSDGEAPICTFVDKPACHKSLPVIS